MRLVAFWDNASPTSEKPDFELRLMMQSLAMPAHWRRFAVFDE